MSKTSKTYVPCLRIELQGALCKGVSMRRQYAIGALCEGSSMWLYTPLRTIDSSVSSTKLGTTTLYLFLKKINSYSASIYLKQNS